MTHEQYQKGKTEEAFGIACATASGSLNPIEGCRRLAALRTEVGDAFQEHFRYFVAVDSETDHLPVTSDVRSLCGVEYLQRADQEIASYVAAEGSRIASECRRLASVLKGTPFEEAHG